MSDRSLEFPTHLPDGEAALVTFGEMKGLHLMVPDWSGRGGEPVPEMMLFLTACMVRCDSDPAWKHMMIEWLQMRDKSQGTGHA